MLYTIYGALLLAIVFSNKNPRALIVLIVRSIFLGALVGCFLILLAVIPPIRKFYVDYDVYCLRTGFSLCAFIVGFGIGWYRESDVGMFRRIAATILLQMAALPLMLSALIVLSRWNVPRLYAADLTDAIGAGVVVMIGFIAGTSGSVIGVILSAIANSMKPHDSSPPPSEEEVSYVPLDPPDSP